MLCTGNGRENLPPGCVEPEEDDEMFVPDPCCFYCNHYTGDYCMKDWNNAEEEYCDPYRDSRDEYDLCEDYEWNGEYDDKPQKPEPPKKAWFKNSPWRYQVAMTDYLKRLRKWNHYMKGEEE